MGNVALTFPNTAGTDSNGDLTTDGGWDWPDQRTNKHRKQKHKRSTKFNETALQIWFFGRTPTAIAPGCDVAKIYEKVWHLLIAVPYLNKFSICFLRIAPIYQITFGTCTKSTQPNSADTYHMEVSFLFCLLVSFFMYILQHFPYSRTQRWMKLLWTKTDCTRCSST